MADEVAEKTYPRVTAIPLIDVLKEKDPGFTKDITKMMNMARLCEVGSQWQDGADVMVELFLFRFNDENTDSEPKREERDLLSNHFKNLVGALRTAYREISNGAPAELDEKLKIATQNWIKKEMTAKSMRLINLVQENLFEKQGGPQAFGEYLKNIENPDKAKKEWIQGKVFYLKMCGDYYRYIAELTKGDERNGGDKTAAKDMYEAAMKAAKEHLSETDPTRLGLALNWSVCCFELLEKPDDAKKIAKAAFDNAIQKLDTLNDASYKDSTLIMQLLRDNLTIWTTDDDRNKEEGTQMD